MSSSKSVIPISPPMFVDHRLPPNGGCFEERIVSKDQAICPGPGLSRNLCARDGECYPPGKESYLPARLASTLELVAWRAKTVEGSPCRPMADRVADQVVSDCRFQRERDCLVEGELAAA